MKKFKLLSVFFLLSAAVSLTSCNSDDGNEPVVTPPATGTLTATMGDEQFVATQAQAAFSNGMLIISGVRGANNENITMMVQGNTAGTYPGGLMSYNTSAEELEYVNMNPQTAQRNGTVTITSITNTNVTGTFTFTGYNFSNNTSILFTEGAFSVPLTVQEALAGQGEITAFIDGVQANFGFATVMAVNGKFILQGMNMGNMHNIQIHMSSLNPGTYALTDVWDEQNFAVIGGEPGTVDSISGTYTITSNSNGYLIGTFSFTGEDMDGNTVNVSGGQFNAQIAPQ